MSDGRCRMISAFAFDTISFQVEHSALCKKERSLPGAHRHFE